MDISKPNGTSLSDLRIVVISMSSSDRRRALVSDNLRTLRYPWQFFDALTSDESLPVSYDEQKALVFRGRRLASSEIGCFASHIAVLMDFVHNRNADSTDWLFVIEDDVHVDVTFPFLELCQLLTASKIDYLRCYSRYL